MSARCLAAVPIIVSLLAAAPARSRQPPDYSGSCTAAACHAAYKTKPVVHGPVQTDTCDACHEPVEGEAHRFEWVEEGQADLCAECHELDEVKVEHQPVADGECTSCHDPHAADAAGLLIETNVGDVCNECHDEITEDRAYLHGPTAAGSCTACHDPHGSDHAGMLLAPGPELCAKCHAQMQKRIDGPRRTSGLVHPPVKQGCTDCHDPHGAESKMMLQTQPPELCLACHDELSDLLDEATAEHEVVTSQDSCLNCHDPHESGFEHLLTQQPMALCLSCHNKRLKSGDGELRNIAEHLRSHSNHHGPIKDNDCTTCHNPHGSSVVRMLTDAFPAGFYASYDEDEYALCFGCHDSEMAEEEETEDATGFRNGSRNLHYLHVNRTVKGRTCRACHDFHAGNNPKHTADAVPFGQWSIPILLEFTPTGGSCLPGCHRRYRYDRNEPVNNLPTP